MPTTNQAEKEAGLAAGRRTQAAVDAVNQGGVRAESIIHRSGGAVDAHEGDYELTARSMTVRVSKPGEPVRTRTFRRGDTVHLSETDAGRLLRGGAVKPTTDEQAKAPAAQEPRPKDTAKSFGVVASGGVPIPDVDKPVDQQ